MTHNRLMYVLSHISIPVLAIKLSLILSFAPPDKLCPRQHRLRQECPLFRHPVIKNTRRLRASFQMLSVTLRTPST